MADDTKTAPTMTTDPRAPGEAASIEKIGGGYGGPVRVLCRFHMSDGAERFVVGFKPEGGYGECAHIFSRAQLSGLAGGECVAPPPGAAPASGEPGVRTLERVRHVKRGTEYEVLGEAEAQISDPRRYTEINEGERLVIYRCLDTGKLWCQEPKEFRDGRFETIATPTPGGAHRSAGNTQSSNRKEVMPDDAGSTGVRLRPHVTSPREEVRASGGDPANPGPAPDGLGDLVSLKAVARAIHDVDVHAEAQRYEFRDPDHTPTDAERTLLEDFAAELLSKAADAILDVPTPRAPGPGGGRIDRQAVNNVLVSFVQHTADTMREHDDGVGFMAIDWRRRNEVIDAILALAADPVGGQKVERDPKRFAALSADGRPAMPEGYSAPLDMPLVRKTPPQPDPVLSPTSADPSTGPGGA